MVPAMRRAHLSLLAPGIFLVFALAQQACGGDGKDGAPGPAGANGKEGTDGTNGSNGSNGSNGNNGTSGEAGAPGPAGGGALGGSLVRAPGIDPSTPLSGTVAFTLRDPSIPSIAHLTKSLADRYAKGTLGDIQFPVRAAATDTVRGLAGLTASVVVKWGDPLTFSANGSRFGANNDYVAYFGEGWSGAPQWSGRGDVGWMWVNHEYISGSMPGLTNAPNGQHVTLAKLLKYMGGMSGDPTAQTWTPPDIAAYVTRYKKEIGGTWMRVVLDPATSTWSVDRTSASLRYDGTSATLVKITGTQVSQDHADDGTPLPAGVAAGILGDCSGGQTPWGTIISAEENVQDYYGDVEACWSSDQKLLAGAGCDAGANVSFTLTPSTSSEFGKSPDTNAHHARDLYGYLVEIDPGVAPGEYEGKTTAGVGHKKLGAFGRARWENATFAVDADWKLVNNKPIVIYGGDDRRSGRIFKFVSKNVYTSSMTKAQTRALLDEGTIYVAHFAGIDNEDGYKMKATGKPPTDAARGTGKWIKLSVDSTDIAPNSTTVKVGDALKDVNYNRIGGFATNDDVRRALFTASNKIGVMELNRPEDLEWNPKAPGGKAQLFIVFTNNGRRTALDQDGKVFDPATHSTQSKTRPDAVGAIFVLEETQDPSSFTFFQAWGGSKGKGDTDAANPDNLMIDKDGGVWFGTDGNFGTNSHADSIYYLDLDPNHAAGKPGIVKASYGVALRVVAMPSDAEATGPAFTPDMRTLFVAVQHPGETVFSTWP
jgi:hypothetical protein